MALSPSCDEEIVFPASSFRHENVAFSPPVNEIATSFAPSARPSSELAKPPSSVEPSSPSSSDNIAYMDDEMEMETYFTREDDTNKKNDNDLVPRKDMTFASLEEFESFYYNFVISKEYTIQIRRAIQFAHANRIR